MRRALTNESRSKAWAPRERVWDYLQFIRGPHRSIRLSHPKIAARIPDHFLGIYDSVEILRADEPLLQCSVAQCHVVVESVLGNRRSLVVPLTRPNPAAHHQPSFPQFADPPP